MNAPINVPAVERQHRRLLTPRTLGFRSLINVTAKGINSLLTRTTNLVVPHRTRGPQRAARPPGRRHPGVYHITNPLANFGRSVDHFTASSAFLTPKARGLGERENHSQPDKH